MLCQGAYGVRMVKTQKFSKSEKLTCAVPGELIAFFSKFSRLREEFSALLRLIFLLRSFIQLKVERCIKNYLFHIIFFCY